MQKRPEILSLLKELHENRNEWADYLSTLPPPEEDDRFFRLWGLMHSYGLALDRLSMKLESIIPAKPILDEEITNILLNEINDK